jgi:uncharacterized membrane protein
MIFTSVAPRIRWTQRVAVGALLALVALGLAWELRLAPLRPGGSWWALKVLPLALPLAGLLRLRLYTYRWVALGVWLYVTEGLVRATSERGTGAWLAALQVVLALVVFAACAAHVRWRLGAARATTETAT